MKVTSPYKSTDYHKFMYEVITWHQYGILAIGMHVLTLRLAITKLPTNF